MGRKKKGQVSTEARGSTTWTFYLIVAARARSAFLARAYTARRYRYLRSTTLREYLARVGNLATYACSPYIALYQLSHIEVDQPAHPLHYLDRHTLSHSLALIAHDVLFLSHSLSLIAQHQQNVLLTVRCSAEAHKTKESALTLKGTERAEERMAKAMRAERESPSTSKKEPTIQNYFIA